jgi:hypothetical protein
VHLRLNGFGMHFEDIWNQLKRVHKMSFRTQAKNFGTMHGQFPKPSQFHKSFQQKLASYQRELREII